MSGKPAIAGQQPKRRAPARRTKIDWREAFQVFATDPTLGYAGVARRFGVSDVSVRKHAVAENWLERAQAIRDRAAEKAAEHTVAEFQRQAKSLGHELLARLRESITKGSEAPKPSDYASIVKTLQLLYGEATDRVALAEVQALVAAFVRVTAENVPPERRDLVLGELAELERTFGSSLVAIEGGGSP